MATAVVNEDEGEVSKACGGRRWPRQCSSGVRLTDHCRVWVDCMEYEGASVPQHLLASKACWGIVLWVFFHILHYISLGIGRVLKEHGLEVYLDPIGRMHKEVDFIVRVFRQHSLCTGGVFKIYSSCQSKEGAMGSTCSMHGIASKILL